MNLPPFRFGVVFVNNYSAREWTDGARRLEAEGFSTLLVADHYDNPMACGPLMLAAASATTTLRVGSYVYNNDFRHPALLAKEVATIDVLSEGRLELGIGAGYNREEYEATGLPFSPPGVRASRFEEAVDIIQRLLRGETVTFSGQYYSLREYEGLPLPAQHPVPLLIGGGGPRMLGIAARSAQIVAFAPRSLPGGGLDAADFASIDHKLDQLKRSLETHGRGAMDLERSILLMNIYTSMDSIPEGSWVPRDVVATSPFTLVGDLDGITESLLERRERLGLSYFVCYDHDLETFIPVVRRLAQS
jgi:probable F420-dependent oxidoreductase